MGERPGVSYGEAGNILKWSLCANCHGPLKRIFHPTARAPKDWMVVCRKGCETTEVISKKYVEKIKENQQLETDQIRTNLRRNKIMPLPGTHNATPSFREIAKLRKGVTISQTRTRDGREYEVTYPREVDYWVLDFNEAELEAESVFKQAYKEFEGKPKELNIIVPFDEVERFWDAWLRCYKGGQMIAKAGLNESISETLGLDPDRVVWFERLFDVAQEKWLVKHWRIIDKDAWDTWAGEGEELNGYEYSGFGKVNMSVNLSENGEEIGPVIYATEKREYYLEPAGSLRIIIRELAPFLGYVTLHTTGKADIYNISGELAGMALRAQQAQIPLHQLPMKLVRRKESGRKPDGSASVHYNTHVILDPAFSEKMYRLQVAESEKRFAQLEVIDVPALQSGPVPGDENGDDFEDGYFEELPSDSGPAEWSSKGLVRTKEDFKWICDKAGVDLDTATGIFNELKKDYTRSYNYVLDAYKNPLGLIGEEK